MKQLRHFGIRVDHTSKNMPYVVEYLDDQGRRTEWKKARMGWRGDNFNPNTGEIIDKELYRAQLGRVQPDTVYSTDSKEKAEAKKVWLLQEGWPKVRIKTVEHEDIKEASKDNKTFGA